MTIKNLKKLKGYLQYSLEIDSDCCLLEEDKQAIIETIEKQIPKKLKIKQKGNDVLDFRCPLCDKKIISKVGERFVAGSKDNFCPNCGQALDWSK